jgi:hypothetical protein
MKKYKPHGKLSENSFDSLRTLFPGFNLSLNTLRKLIWIKNPKNTAVFRSFNSPLTRYRRSMLNRLKKSSLLATGFRKL